MKKNKIDLLNELTEKWVTLEHELSKSKKECEGNLWHELTERELQSKEYEIKYLKEKLTEQSETLKRIKNLSNNYFTEPKPEKKRTLASTDTSVEIHYFKTTLTPIINLLFEPTEFYQWECLLNVETPPTPIIIKKGIGIKDVRFFLNKLSECGIIIKNYPKLLASSKAIYFNNKPLKVSQLKSAQTEINKSFPKKAPIIEDFFNEQFK